MAGPPELRRHLGPGQIFAHTLGGMLGAPLSSGRRSGRRSGICGLVGRAAGGWRAPLIAGVVLAAIPGLFFLVRPALPDRRPDRRPDDSGAR